MLQNKTISSIPSPQQRPTKESTLQTPPGCNEVPLPLHHNGVRKGLVELGLSSLSNRNRTLPWQCQGETCVEHELPPPPDDKEELPLSGRTASL